MKTCVKEELLRAIGSQLRKLKINKDSTTKEIAALLNITPQAYGNIERGESDICITRLILLSAYFKVSFCELIPQEYLSFENFWEAEMAGRITKTPKDLMFFSSEMN